MTQYFQLVRGWTPLHAGVATLPTLGGALVGAPLSPWLLSRLGSSRATALGLFWVAVGLGLGAVVAHGGGYPVFGVGVAVVGYGMATAMTPAADALMGSLDKDRAGVGSAVNDTTQEVGGALGVAILGSIVGAAYSGGLHVAGAPATVHRSLAAALVTASRLPPQRAVGARLGCEGVVPARARRRLSRGDGAGRRERRRGARRPAGTAGARSRPAPLPD